MRIPKSPPSWRQVFEAPSVDAPSIFALLARDDVTEMVRRANESYLHWDKLRRYPMPEGVAPHVMWAGVALNRTQQFRTLDLSAMDDDNIKFWTPIQHQAWLHKIDTGGGGTIGSRSRYFPNDDTDTFLFNSLMEEAIASSQLEGASTTRAVA